MKAINSAWPQLFNKPQIIPHFSYIPAVIQSFRSQHRAFGVSSSEILNNFTFLRYSCHYSKFSKPAICISVSQQQRSLQLVLQDLPSLVYICGPLAGNRNNDITDSIQTYNTKQLTKYMTKHVHLKVIRALVFYENISELSFNH